MTWILYRHSKGMNYLGLGGALHSETKEIYEVYRCLYDNDLGKSWIRPKEMFEGSNEKGKKRFEPIARIRIVEPEDEPTVLAFGYDTWGQGHTPQSFIDSYQLHSRNHLRGTRYLLETLEGEAVTNLNVLRLGRGVLGIASIATAPEQRRKGYAQLLLKSVMELKRMENSDSVRFLLFSEVSPRIYESSGFRVLEEQHQHFKPALAMATGSSPLDPRESVFLKSYF